MATGMARGAKSRGKRIAFGDGQQIIWDHQSELIFRNNPNIAHPGDEGADDLEWIAFYRGHRIYNLALNNRWKWNYSFRPIPGEFYFDDEELEFGRSFGNGFVLIEPNVPKYKSVASNKTWPMNRYAEVARRLATDYRIAQFSYPGCAVLPGAKQIKTPTFRHAAAVLANAALYVGPEGGLHHAAAAVGTKAVVIFGGFIPPEVTGYPQHVNISRGKACGSLRSCPHCREAMNGIRAEEVHRACVQQLSRDRQLDVLSA